MEKRFNIFISHSIEDRDWASRLAEALRERGLSVWDERQVAPGENLSQSIPQALENSSHGVFLVGRDAARSNWFGFELGMALAAGKQIIPIVDKDLPKEQIPGPIRVRQYLERLEPGAVAEEIAHAVAA